MSLRKALNAVIVSLVTFFGPSFAGAQTTHPTPVPASLEVASGIKLRPNGVIDVGPIYIEVNHYDANWTISQQHDKFTTTGASAEVAAASEHMFVGTLSTAQGPANYTETVKRADGGVDFSAKFTAEKPFDTQELSVALLLPTQNFGGKEIKVDGEAKTLPTDPQKKGEPRIFEKDGASKVEIPIDGGMLTIAGDFKFLVQDDREWGDPRYSMRLSFSPGAGAIKESRIDLKIRVDPAKH